MKENIVGFIDFLRGYVLTLSEVGRMAIVFVGVGVAQIMLGLVFGVGYIDGMLYLVLGLFLFRYEWKVVAGILVGLTGLTLGATLANIISGNGGGTNILMAVVMFGAALRGWRGVRV